MVESSQLFAYSSLVSRLIFFLFLPILIFGDKVFLALEESEVNVPAPWLTGPLLAPSSFVVPMGSINVEPYIFATAETGVYNSDWEVLSQATFWELNSQEFIQFGMAPLVDFEFTLSGFYDLHAGKASWALGDLPVGIGIQLWQEALDRHGWAPNVKLLFREIFPIGKYKNLDPKKAGTDGQGAGSFNTQFGLIFGKIFHLSKDSFFVPRLLLQYSLPAPVSLRGFNVYGGGYGARGTIFPGQNFEADIGVELSLSRNWALACDLVGTWSARSRFQGNPGMTPAGKRSRVGAGSSVQYSLAPAIEYNWNASIGVIGGGWFTLGGKNSSRFWSAVFAFNYYN